MKIAVLGWGSLIWDTRELLIKSPFVLEGPELPIEFARISKDSRLTLVVDDHRGVNCQTYAALSGFDNIPEAVKNLAAREGTTTANVHFQDLHGKQSAQAFKNNPHAVSQISNWLMNTTFDGAIWTGLPSNFCDRYKEIFDEEVEFSAENAMQYLQKLSNGRIERAKEYIRNAPPEIKTPVRLAFEKSF